MRKIIKIVAATTALTAALTTRAAAEVCLLFICLGGDGGGSTGGSGGGTPQAPEISMEHGLAALAVLVCVGLLLRERFLRQRSA